jgi:hypothetical protein
VLHRGRIRKDYKHPITPGHKLSQRLFIAENEGRDEKKKGARR